MTKAHETPKLDATVKNIAEHIEIPLPDYQRPWEEFIGQAVIGRRVRVLKRMINAANNGYDLVERAGVVSDRGENSVTIRTATQFVTIPWWSIHDWAIIETEV